MNVNALIESIVRTYALSSLKGLVASPSDKGKIESGDDGMEEFLRIEKFKEVELSQISNQLFATSHFYCHIYETERAIDFNKLKNARNNLPDDWMAHKTMVEDRSFDGFIEVDISLQAFDLNVVKYTGDNYQKKCYVPFRVKQLSEKHIGIMFSKFEIKEFNDGSNFARVLENPHSSYELAESAVQYWQAQKLIPSAMICDLNKGLKKLVRNKVINSLNVTVEFDGGAHENRKEGKKKTHYKFVPDAWHNQYLMTADRIMRAKWYWFSGATTKSIRGLPSISIEPSSGLVSQDAFVQESQENLIDELLAANT